ncbi:MAG TPA: hypothetical protein DCZ04_15250 [Syntrophorhabdus aromaticivorans]|nr:hypothetical protein [Syntrophorhabdus aromaticivorans]
MNRKRITFKFHAPDAKSVHLAGNFNDWNTSFHPLSQVKTSKGDGVCGKELSIQDLCTTSDSCHGDDF